MIYDKIQNISLYKGLTPALDTGLEFISKANANLPLGVTMLDNGVKAIVSEYETKPVNEKGYEAHRQYIDIQFPVVGLEMVKCCPVEFLKPHTGYNAVKDCIHYSDSDGTFLQIGAGYFLVLFPEDGHMPQLAAGEPDTIKKVTLKIPVEDMFTLIDLPYTMDALEPVLSSRTIEFHHGRHLKGYVDNLNKLLAGSDLKTATLEDLVCSSASGAEGPLAIPEATRQAIFNNAGQIMNHNLYFTQFGPCRTELAEESVPTGKVADQIAAQWGSFEAFKNDFVAKGVSLFGSGWVWLSAEKDGNLVITQEHNAGNPVTKGLKPLLCFDVWEHAYYLDYHNRRQAHLEALWSIVDWAIIEGRYEE